MATRIGVDVGGTFTDLVFYDGGSGQIQIAKGPSTSDSPDRGVLELFKSELAPADLARSEYFLHGTTVALNALLEKKVATVGLLTTAGFRDTLELRRGDRVRMNDYRWLPPDPLVPRDRRFEVRERMRADGSVLTELNGDDVGAACQACQTADVDVIAVLYLNSYANPDHEITTEKLLRAHGFLGEVVLSHEISREFKEYERTSTTVVDASARPIMTSYLGRLSTGLRELGMNAETLITNSGGGAMTFEEGETRSFLTIQSGPVAGAVAPLSSVSGLVSPRASRLTLVARAFDT